MARYYDIDKLKEMIETKADTLIEGKEAFLYVAKWLNYLPTADVIPRAEHEAMIAEIFAEIETLLALNSRIGDVFTGKYFDEDLENDIAELKKQYLPKGE